MTTKHFITSTLLNATHENDNKTTITQLSNTNIILSTKYNMYAYANYNFLFSITYVDDAYRLYA